MRALQKVGFKTIQQYYNPEKIDNSAIVLWDLNSKVKVQPTPEFDVHFAKSKFL